MNKYLRIITYVVLVVLSVSLYAEDEVGCITYVDNYSTNLTAENTLRTILDKQVRLSNKAGEIVVRLNDVPDSIAVCINAAVDIWESIIKNDAPVYLNFYYKVLESGNDVETDVYYFRASDGVNYPSTLYYNIKADRDSSANNENDANIYINADSDWDCSHSSVILTDSKNMTYAMLRAIGVSFGFGSSVIERTSGIIGFSFIRGYSVFDKLILSSANKKLSDITNLGNRKNTALENYVQCVDGSVVYVSDSITSRRMYAPTEFEPYKSLIYLNNPNSLMHYDLKGGDKCMQIDTTTINILKEIGWSLDYYRLVNIQGDNIGDNGIASAYEKHRFNIQNNTSSEISNAKWSYKLPLVSGKDTIISYATDCLSFEIPAISDASGFSRSINGDIYGVITFSGIVGDVTVNESYRISLELKPFIKSVEVKNKILNTPLNTSYDIYYTVEHYGSEKLTISIEEDYSSELRTSYVYEPFLAHIVSHAISSNYYAWIDIKASNKYGDDMYTIELEPYSGSSLRTYSKCSSIGSLYNNSDTSITVFDTMGRMLSANNKISDLQSLPQGIYMLKIFCDDKCTKTVKYYKQ